MSRSRGEGKSLGATNAFSENLFLEPVRANAGGVPFSEFVSQVDSALEYELFISRVGSVGDAGSASVYVVLLNEDEEVLAGLAQSLTFDESLEASGPLVPGLYLLRAHSESWTSADQYSPDGGSANASFSLGFSMAPELTPILLVASGVALLAAWSRRCGKRTLREGRRC